ncbi:angiogenic factor with G patch and FHA domains 1 isoform X2 [Anabrus simplex]|uniref:angiogenic factor with G patch and FHA domains 1 isoform X2 n=1 Tax=Anabrus simplex TaxID=316456 RepID=UPI0035A2EB0C
MSTEEACKIPDSPQNSCNMSDSCDSETENEQVDCKFDYVLNDHSIDAFQEELQYLPDVASYINDLENCIRHQQQRIKSLSRKLRTYEEIIAGYHNTCDVGTQTDVIEDVSEEAPWQPSEEKSSVTEEVTKAAQSAMLQTGFVYEETSGMYYDYNTGYYYNAEYGLYYDGDTGIYYSYDEESRNFLYHSQIENFASVEEMSKVNNEDSKKPKSREVDELLEEQIISMSQLSLSGRVENALGASSPWPPCIRIIVQETNSARIKVGSLFIVTYPGGTLGREGDHSVLLPDINISKVHAKFTFNETEKMFFVADFGSCNGTYLNGTRLSSSKEESESYVLLHGSVLEVGGTKLLCHIHCGRETCGHCEPGLIQPAPSSSEHLIQMAQSRRSLKTEHKKEVDRIKRKFGLVQGRPNFPEKQTSNYEDRAQIRRETVGSQHHSEKTASSSVYEPIAPDNKGFKLMSKMGWSPGHGLGKDSTGCTEPIAVTNTEGKTGLGAMPSPPPMSPSYVRKAAILKKTQKRYKKL